MTKLLSTTPRTQANLEGLEKLLSIRMPDFARLSYKERMFLCEIMRLESLIKGTVVLWETHTITGFYFILHGQVEIFKIDHTSNFKLRVSLICHLIISNVF